MAGGPGTPFFSTLSGFESLARTSDSSVPPLVLLGQKHVLFR